MREVKSSEIATSRTTRFFVRIVSRSHINCFQNRTSISFGANGVLRFQRNRASVSNELIMLRSTSRTRPAAAAVELAFVVLFFFIPVLFGIWEAGRLIEVQQIVSNSAREGARLASQGYTINSSGAPTQITAANVRDVAYQYLVAARFANLQPSDVTVTFAFILPKQDGTTPTDPYLGEKNQPYIVTVSIPWDKVRWINVGLIRPTDVSFTVTWQMLIDDKFTVKLDIPPL